MIHILSEKATQSQLRDMLDVYPTLIKLAIDVRHNILAGGGEMHADCESALLGQGSDQDDIWGANWYPEEQRLEYEALINIRPSQGNRSMIIQDENLRKKVETIVFSIFGV